MPPGSPAIYGVLLGLLALASAAAGEPGDKISLSAAQAEAVKAAVKEGLKDPYSAMFGARISAAASGADVIVCGTVNAKNAYGGYVGMQPFMVYGFSGGARFVLVKLPATDTEASAIAGICAQEGAALE